MYDYLVVLEVPALKLPASLKSCGVMVSNRYAAGKLAKYGRYLVDSGVERFGALSTYPFSKF